MYKLAVLLLLCPTVSLAEETFLSPLKKDQKVSLVSKNDYYEIIIVKDLKVDLLYVITEVGKDYVVIEDYLGVNEIRISIYRIKSITTKKLPK